MSTVDWGLISCALAVLALAEYFAIAVMVTVDDIVAGFRDARRRRPPGITYSRGQVFFSAANDSDACDVMIDLSAERSAHG